MQVTTRPSLIAPPPDNLLRLYTAYRLLLSALLYGIYALGGARDVLGTASPGLYSATALSYLVLATLFSLLFKLLAYRANTPTLLLTLLIDITAITLITHACGGLESGLSLLLLVVVAAGSLFLKGQLALLVAAMASLAVLTVNIAPIFRFSQTSGQLLQAGLLGILLFVTALIFQVLNRRAQQAQNIAEIQTSQAEQLQQLNESIIKRMHTGIIVVSADDRIRLINGSAIQLLGGQKLGRPLNRGQTLRAIKPLFEQLERWRAYPWLRTPTFQVEDSPADIQANFSALEGNTSQDRQTLIFLEDSRVLAQHAQQLKLSSLGRLTGSIAHEIRNPLGAISHASQLLQESDANEQQNKLVDIIRRHTVRVNQIVENVMQLSQQKPPELQKISLKNWLKGFREDYLENQKMAGSIDIRAPDEDIQVSFDLSHLSQILNNLADNALRFSEQQTGTREAVFNVSLNRQSGLPLLDIVDNGPGVTEDDQQHLFEPFFTTRHEGSGLGLYLARELCRVNYATLSYHNAPEGGAVFRIEFPHPDRLLPRVDRE